MVQGERAEASLFRLLIATVAVPIRSKAHRRWGSEGIPMAGGCVSAGRETSPHFA
jgi:hypothetical protein